GYHGWLAGGRAGRRRGLNLNASRAAGFAFRRDTASISEEIESVSNQFGALRILAAATTLKQLNAVFGVDGSPMPVGETNARVFRGAAHGLIAGGIHRHCAAQQHRLQLT